MKNLGTRLKVIFVLTNLCIILISPTILANSGSVSARYSKPRGDHIKWKIRIPSPPPAAIIVTQYILPGSAILQSSHQLSSYDKEKGIAKWLLAPPFPAMLKMQMKLSRPIRKKGEIHGEIQFMDASHNVTSSIFMRPRAMKKAMEGC